MTTKIYLARVVIVWMATCMILPGEAVAQGRAETVLSKIGDTHVSRILAEDGERVTRGQLLVVLDSTRLLMRIADERLEVDRANAVVEERRVLSTAIQGRLDAQLCTYAQWAWSRPPGRMPTRQPQAVWIGMRDRFGRSTRKIPPAARLPADVYNHLSRRRGLQNCYDASVAIDPVRQVAMIQKTWSELRMAGVQVAEAQSQARWNRTVLEEARRGLQGTLIRAPVDGRLLLTVSVGDLVNTGTRLGTIERDPPPS